MSARACTSAVDELQLFAKKKKQKNTKTEEKKSENRLSNNADPISADEKNKQMFHNP